MSTFIALLRGINVSGHRMIPMAKLRASCEELGFSNVRTYVQSGNVVFDAKRGEPAKFATKIESRIRADFGHEVPTVVVTSEEIAKIAAKNPLLDEFGGELKRFHAVFASAPISSAQFGKLRLPTRGDERAVLAGSVILLHTPYGAAETKLTNAFFEKALGVSTTARNWRTVLALRDLCADA